MADIPMFHFDVRPVPEPYHSPYVQSMAQLIGAGDRYQADAIQQSAAATAKGVENIGANVGGTLMDYAKYELAQRSPVVQLQKLKVQKEMEDMADDDLIQKTVAANGGDVDKALGALRQGGNVSVSALGKLQKQVDDSRNAALKSSKDILDYRKGVLTQASQMYPEAPAKPDDPDQVAAFTGQYANVYPSLVKTVGPDFAPNLPKPDDPDLVAKVDTLRKWGLTASEAIRLQNAGLAKIEEARRAKDDDRKAADSDTKGVGLRLSTAQTQADWDGILAESKAQGVSPLVLARFPAEFSPQGVNTARVLASGKPDEPPKLGTLEDTITRWAKENNVAPGDISEAQILKLTKAHAIAQHVDSANAGGALTPEQVQGYVDVIKAHPGAYKGLTETLRGQLMVPLAKAGFTGFDAPTQQAVVAANNVRTRELNRITRDVAQGVYQNPQDAEDARSRVEATYRIALGQAAPFDPNNQTNVFGGTLPPTTPAKPPVALNPNLPTPAPVPGARPGSGLPVPPATIPAPYGLREDGTPKGDGFLGLLKRKDGKVSSEISIGVNINGKEVEIPTMVPTLDKSEVDWLLSNDVSDPKNIPASIKDKAITFARKRIANGQSPFAGPDESPQAAPEAGMLGHTVTQRTAPSTPGSQYVIPPPMGPQDLLKGMKPGKYKLSDGTKWQVNRDGSVVKAP